MAHTSLYLAATQIVEKKQALLVSGQAANVSLSVSEIQALLVSTNLEQDELHRVLLILEASCRSQSRLKSDIAGQVWQWTLAQIEPGRIFTYDGVAGEAVTWGLTGNVALHLLAALTRSNPLLSSQASITYWATLIFWSTSTESWILSDCRETAAEQLLMSLDNIDGTRFKSQLGVKIALLEQVVRPGFVRSKPKNITSAGRKAINPQDQASTSSEDDKVLKPWKFQQRYVVDTLIWVVDSSDSIEDSWHLITPPVLTLIDDEIITNKVRGCQLLQILLEKVSSKAWTRTGLGKVFEDALIPALAYLPPLTDQVDAERLLTIIYSTLLALCKAQFSAPDQLLKRVKLLDKILRSGILSGLSYSGENVKISSLLLDQLPTVLEEMGIHCVKHLETLVTILVGYLCDPFAFASLRLLQSAITALQSVILNAWPRLDQYCGEILKGIAVCWQRLSEESDTNLIVTARKGLRFTLSLLEKALGGSSKLGEIKNVLQSDKILRGLLT